MVSLGSEHSGFVRDGEERCDQSCLPVGARVKSGVSTAVSRSLFQRCSRSDVFTMCCKTYNFARTEVSKE